MSIRLVDEEAGDPPVGWVGRRFAVGAAELDPRQLVGGTELAPADAQVAIEDERGVGLTVADTTFLLRPMVGASFPAFRMERDAPAAAPHTVVAFDEPGEVGPRVGVERLDGIAGHRRKLAAKHATLST